MSKRLITAEDVQRFELVANPVLSPDGRLVVWEKTVPDVKEDGYTTQLVISDTEGRQIRALTSSGTNNSGAQWSPDGTVIAFVSDRACGSQVWVLPMNGGEARQLTRFRHGMSGLQFSADGKTLFGLVPVRADEEIAVYAPELSDKEIKEEREKEKKDFANGPKRITRLTYKGDGEGFHRGLHRQLVAVDVATGDFRQLTFGPYNVGSPAVSPDGKYIAFCSNRTPNPDIEWWKSNIYRVPVAGGDLELLCDTLSAQTLSYSPDGHTLAVAGHGEELFTYWSAAHTHLFLLPAEGGAVTHVTAQFPDQIGCTNLTDMRGNARGVRPTWSQDGKYLYELSTREGRSEVVRFDIASGTFEAGVVIGGDRDVFGFSYDGDSLFVISYATQTNPCQMAAVSVAHETARPRTFRGVTEAMHEQKVAFFPAEELRLDDSNIRLLEELTVVEPEAFYYTSQDDWRVQGWVMKPAHYEAGKKYPVILEIHGGPQLNYGYAMFHEMQWFAAQGYAVVLTNPRGGMSYGQAFVNAVRLHYGDGDAADVQNGLDAALATFEFLDSSRVAVTGGSYGGFMTNWLVGHTDRFFAAASQRSISNWLSFYGVSDVGPLFVESQLGGDIFTNRERLWEMSPLAYAQNVKTPLLLIHSENDLRCPMEQAEQFYVNIKRFGGEVELVRIPNASHGLSRNGKPKLRIERLNAIFGYIHDHLPQA
ncbi:MAG: S9 family peptidase [Firmicutes bacterium]|nr:S9 family peptidase [Bacillota bacterium]